MPRGASHETIHRAYRILARRLHPDVASAQSERVENMAAVNEAWEVLGDDAARHAYDESIGITRKPLVALLSEPSLPRGFGPIGGHFQGGYSGRHDPQRPGHWQLAIQALSDDLSGLADADDREVYRLGLRHVPVSAQLLRGLSRFGCMEELILANTSLTDECVAELLAFSKLRTLDVDACAITDVGLSQLATIATLEELLLFGTEVTDAGMASLAFHPRLAVIDLRETAVTEVGIPPLLTVPELHELRLPKRARKARHRVAEVRPEVRVL